MSINVGEQICVLWACFVEVGVINTHSPFCTGFFHHDNIGKPHGICDFSDDSGFKERRYFSKLSFSLGHESGLRDGR